MKFTVFIISVSIVTSALYAKPKIEFESKVVDCGIVMEHKADKLEAVFIAKNTGDQVLKIESVRPGCGCTVVKFDSLIPPGKKAKIESAVDIKGYRSGKVSKTITVISNAVNEPTVRLTIEATIQAPIEPSTSYLNFTNNQGDSAQIIYLATKKNDLQIKSVEFKSSETSSNAPSWQENLSQQISFKMLPIDSVRNDGLKVYKMAISPVHSAKPMSGEFIIETNHPDQKQVLIRGRIGG